jgi:hypothetical protein
MRARRHAGAAAHSTVPRPRGRVEAAAVTPRHASMHLFSATINGPLLALSCAARERGRLACFQARGLSLAARVERSETPGRLCRMDRLLRPDFAALNPGYDRGLVTGPRLRLSRSAAQRPVEQTTMTQRLPILVEQRPDPEIAGAIPHHVGEA